MAKWTDVLSRALRGRKSEEDAILNPTGITVSKPLFSGDPPMSRRDSKELAHLGTTDFMPMAQTVYFPSRKADKLMQTTSDFYLYKVEKYWENEALIYRIINKMVEMIMQSGFDLKCEDPQVLAKISAELKMVLRNSRFTWRSFCRKTTHDFCLYGNVFQNPEEDVEKKKWDGVRFFDPLTISAIVNKDSGELVQWVRRQVTRKRGDIEKLIRKVTPGKIQTALTRYFSFIPRVITLRAIDEDEKLDLDEVIHIGYMELHQTAISIPPLYPVLEDVLTLRSVEDDISLNSFQYGHPFLHATIDRTDMTREELNDESSLLRDSIQNMEGNGMLVTSDKVKVELKGPQGAFPNLIQYHELFIKRIEKGSGMPDLFTGEGAGVGRQTSDTVEKSVFGMLMDMGQTIAEGLQEFVDIVYNRNVLGLTEEKWRDTTPITIVFNNPNTVEDRADQQHAILVFQGGGIKHSEFRQLLGLPVDPTFANKYFFEIQSEFKMQQDEAAAAAKAKSQQTASNQHTTKTEAGSKKN
jgi:hypothetical protein